MTAKHDAGEMADLRRRADAGDLDVQVYLGRELVASPDAAEREEGRERLALATQAGDLDAYSRLGLSFITSAVGQADFDRGRAVLERGASLGNSWCLYNLGIVQQQGAGVPVDLARASGYWEERPVPAHCVRQGSCARADRGAAGRACTPGPMSRFDSSQRRRRAKEQHGKG